MAAHPPYKIMICKALNCQENGGSRNYIKKYLETNYEIPPTSPYLRRTMRQLINAPQGEPRLYTKGKKRGTYYASAELKAKVIEFENLMNRFD